MLTVWSASSRGLPGAAASFPRADALVLLTCSCSRLISGCRWPACIMPVQNPTSVRGPITSSPTYPKPIPGATLGLPRQSHQSKHADHTIAGT